MFSYLSPLKCNIILVGFDVLTAIVIDVTILWDIEYSEARMWTDVSGERITSV
jgi:hypothetical protein